MLSLVLVVSAALGVTDATPAHTVNVRTLVMLAPRSREKPANDAAEVIRSHLSDTDSTLSVAWVDDFDVGSERAFRLAESVAESHHADVVFWTDYGDPRVLLWYWRDGAVGRLFVQSLGDEGTSRLARTEALGLAVHSATGGTNALGPTVREVPPPIVTSVTASTIEDKPPTEHHLRLGVALGGSGFASEAAVAPTLEASLAVALTASTSAIVAARWMIPPDIDSTYGRLTLRTYSARLGLQHAWHVGDLSFAAGGLGIVGYRGWKFTGSGDFQQAGSSRALAGVAPFVSGAYRLSERVHAVLSIGADIWLNEKSYGVVTAGANQVVTQPWLVAPWLQLAATVDFL